MRTLQVISLQRTPSRKRLVNIIASCSPRINARLLCARRPSDNGSPLAGSPFRLPPIQTGIHSARALVIGLSKRRRECYFGLPWHVGLALTMTSFKHFDYAVTCLVEIFVRLRRGAGSYDAQTFLSTRCDPLHPENV
jgi:hypothetical protein